MRKQLFLLMTLSICSMIVFVSCKKELSCENCGVNPPNSTNKFPIANAGWDQTISLPTDSVLLDGSLSSDPDGTISSFQWTKISGPVSFAVSNALAVRTVVKNLIAGAYHFELKVTDNGGLTSKDTVQIIVYNPSQPNQPPVANAGADQTITLPTNSVNLDGSGSTDPDNNIISYTWTKISGPASFTIVSPNAVQTTVLNLVWGTYQFEMKVTDTGGLFSKDTVRVTVENLPTTCTDCKIVFVSDRDGNPEIYICKADGSNIQRLTNAAGNEDHPTWSPDGTKIAFTSDRSGNHELYIMNRDGSNLVRRTYSGIIETSNPAWSPDGTKIVYSAHSNGSENIWVIGTTSGSPSLLFEAPGLDSQPTWSPDGTKIALVSDWNGYDIVYNIYTINADGTGFTALTTANVFDIIDYWSPSWSPNGTKLAMEISENNHSYSYSQIGIMNSYGGGITVIRSGAAAWSRTSWSGDGTKIAYTSLFGSRMDVSWVSADGSSWGTIVTNGFNADWQH